MDQVPPEILDAWREAFAEILEDWRGALIEQGRAADPVHLRVAAIRLRTAPR